MSIYTHLDDLRDELHDHQNTAINQMEACFLKGTPNVTLIMPAGSGKTRSVLHSCTFPCLYLTPPNVMDHIGKECDVLGIDHKNLTSLTSMDMHNLPRVVICSYATIARQARVQQALSALWATIILDEYHLVCNATNLRKQMAVLRKNALQTISMSATLNDSQVTNFFDPFGTVLVQTPMDTNITNRVIKLALTPPQRFTYNEQVHTTESKLHLIHTMRKWLSCLKVVFVAQLLLQSAPGLKIVVFSDFEQTLCSIYDILKAQSSLVLFLITPKVPIPKRQTFLDIFNTPHHHQQTTVVLLCTRSVCGTGVDVGYADGLLSVEPTYKKYQHEQMMGRISRLNQDLSRARQAVFLQYTDTIEERIGGSREAGVFLSDVNLH